MYVLKVTEEQAKVISDALEFYARIGIGQLDQILWHPAWRMAGMTKESDVDRIETDELLRHSRRALTRDKPALGISAADTDSKRSYDIHQVIRHRISWDNNPEGGLTVDFQEPLNVSGNKFPEFKKED